MKRFLIILCLSVLAFGHVAYGDIKKPVDKVRHSQSSRSRESPFSSGIEGDKVKKIGEPEVLKKWDSGEELTETKISYESGREKIVKSLKIWNGVDVLVKEEYAKKGKILDGEHISHTLSVMGKTTLVTLVEPKKKKGKKKPIERRIVCLSLAGITKPMEDELDKMSNEWNIKKEYIGKTISVKGYGFRQTETINNDGNVTSKTGPVKIGIGKKQVDCDEYYHVLIDQIEFQ